MKKIVMFFSILLILSLNIFSQQNFWEKKNFPSFYDGNICSIAALNDIVFVSTYTSYGYSGGVSRMVKSTDGGNTWDNVTPLPTYYAYSILISSNNYIFAVGTDDILYRSTDEGATWISNSGVHFGNDPKIFQASNGYIYIASHLGIYRSTDFGQTWAPKNNGLTLGSILVTKLAINNSGLLVVATSAGIFKSTNYGDNWTSLPKPIKATEIQPYNVTLNSDGHVFVSLYLMNSYPSDSLYKTTNNGQNWIPIRDGGQNIMCIDKGSDAIIINNGGEQKYSFSTDDGATWSDVQTEGYLYGGFVCNSSSYFLGIGKLGIFKATNLNGPWNFIGNNFPGGKSSVTSILQTNTGTFIVASDTFGVYRSTDDGISFSRVISPFPSSASKLCSTLDGKIFLALSGVAVSSDDGLTWTGLGTSGGNLYDLVAQSIFADGNTVFAGGSASSDAEIDRSTNSGLNWDEVLKIYSAGGDYNSITNIDINNVTILATTKKRVTSPYFSTSYGLRTSTDNGSNWNNVTVGYSPFPIFRDIVWNSSDLVFAATSIGVLYSSDNGTSWSKVSGSLPTNDIRCILKVPNGSLYIGTGDAGIFKSNNNGEFWIQLNDGLSDLEVNTLALDSMGYLWAGTEAGVLKSFSIVVDVSESAAETPKVFLLLQNYPNPFNPNTKISWQSHVSSWQTLKVYDVLGNEVATLVNEYRSAGSYEIEFNPASSIKNPASGVYFYRLQAGDFIETRKMILLR